MLTKSFSLQVKLSATLFIVLAIVGISTWQLAQTTANNYSLEFYQRLNMPITMYMTGEKTFIKDGVANKASLNELAHHVMVVNPSLEIYLLGPQGKILSHALPQGSVQLDSVALAPIQEFLSRDDNNLLLGSDPRDPQQDNIFSVHPIMQDGVLQGYLYAILASQNFQNLLSDARSSHSLSSAALILFMSLIGALLSGIAAFYFLTRRLSLLTGFVNQLDVENILNKERLKIPKSKNHDEIDQLISAFECLLDQNQQQYVLLEENDNNRRELIANISHDLRTPLTSMQGYIETLLIKGEGLSKEATQQFLSIAHKQSKRLGDLVADLFELAKLDNGNVVPNIEPFSLLELVYDLAQEFEIKANNKNAHIRIHAAASDIIVNADIRLIERVFDNLLSNAIRYVSKQGNIDITLDVSDKKIVTVKVFNDGKEINEEERKYIFQRYYRAFNPEEKADNESHSGIGLAIVAKILKLHQCKIELSAEKQNGAEFVFNLPT